MSLNFAIQIAKKNNFIDRPSAKFGKTKGEFNRQTKGLRIRIPHQKRAIRKASTSFIFININSNFRK